MKPNPIAIEVLQTNLSQALAISELLLSANEDADNDLLPDWGNEVERLYILLDDISGAMPNVQR